MGAEGIKELLEEIDLDAELKHLRDELESATGQRLTRAIKRLEVVESFRHSGNNPAWMILGNTSNYPTRNQTNGSIRWWTFCDK